MLLRFGPLSQTQTDLRPYAVHCIGALQGGKRLAQTSRWEQMVGSVLRRDQHDIEVTGQCAMLETVVEQVQLRSEASLRKLASQKPIFSHDHRNLELARDQKWLIAKLLRKSGRIDQKNTAALSPVTTREHIKFHSPGFQKFSQEKNERSLSGTSGRQISDADHRSPQPVC